VKKEGRKEILPNPIFIKERVQKSPSAKGGFCGEKNLESQGG
jgi:hypothetical protein